MVDRRSLPAPRSAGGRPGSHSGRSTPVTMAGSPARAWLRRQLEAHLTSLGYSCARTKRAGSPVSEIVRVSPVRGRIVYGETVLHEDLQRPGCHERLLFFSQRRTRHRSSILFFIGVAEADEPELAALL